MSYRFSANTGFLWKDKGFVEKIHHAKALGFDAVEFHDEALREDVEAIRAALDETGLPVIGLNTRMGPDAGAAVPEFADATRRDIDEAAALAEKLDAGAIHVVGGVTDDPAAGSTFRAALSHALDATDRTVVIEPMCAAAVPGAHLSTLAIANAILDDLDHPRLKILFDCYHIAMEAGAHQVLPLFEANAARVAHIQIASIPDRAEPISGDLDYKALFMAMEAAGYGGAYGCEYRQVGNDADVMAALRAL